jgi:3-oxoacyl-[acyl-carrier-protein] synthase II
LKKVWITEARVVTAAGGLDEMWRALVEKRSAIGEITRFVNDGHGPALGAYIGDLVPQGRHSMIHGLLDRLLEPPLTVPPGALLLTASTKGGIDNLERLHRGEDVDADDILPARLPHIVARKLRHVEPGVNISSACTSSTVALARAASMIRAGLAGSVVVLCLDLLTQFVFSGFSALRIISPRPCRPFDRNRDGLSLGEGAALLVLTDEDVARECGLTCKGVIAGWGVANDAVHILTPASDGRGLVRAITAAMKKANLGPGEVAAISAHGTGTTHNDEVELVGFHKVFGDRMPAVYSVKGAIGHTLGAAGGIEVSIALRCLSKGIVPPTVGFSEGEGEMATRVTRVPEPLRGTCVLATNSGFGGVSCALMIETGPA